MKILGIGNAIVDVICKVDESFIKQNSLTKSTMKLVNEDEFKKLLSNLNIEETISGGSVANSIVGLSQLGNKVGFIGKVSDDELGKKYEDGLKRENVDYFYSKKKESIPTGTCLILITPADFNTLIDQNVGVEIVSNLISNEPTGSSTFHFNLEYCEAGQEIGTEIINGVEQPIVSKAGYTTYQESFWKVVRDSRRLELSDYIIDELDELMREVNKMMLIEKQKATSKAMNTASARRAKARNARLAARNAANLSNAAEPTANDNDAEDDSPL